MAAYVASSAAGSSSRMCARAVPDGNLCEDAALSVQLVHQLDADAAARRDEFDLLDRTLAIGDVRLKVVKRIVRCAAINVDPDTAQRDLAIPPALQRRLGHAV